MSNSTAFADLVARSLNTSMFTLVDIGCSGGIEPAWRVFGDRLAAIGFDASIDECERLTREEKHPNIQYVAGFASLPANHPFAIKMKGKPPFNRFPFDRFSAARTLELRRDRIEAATLTEKLQHNAWNSTRLANPDEPVVVPWMLKELGYADVDFLKIDIDSLDYQVLHSFDDHLDALGLLAARLEVCLFGNADETEQTFHNTDRFMRARGFELFDLEVRHYSMAALPAPYAITMPAQTVTGRAFQADALYARDPAGGDWGELAAALSVEKLAKLAAIFSVWGQPDSAAELLTKFGARLADLLDVSAGLELLAVQAQPGAERPLSYKDYIASFEADAKEFYPAASARPTPPTGPATLGRRLRAVLMALRDPNMILSRDS